MEYWKAFITTATLSAVICYLLIPVAGKFGLIDKPCSRKQHKGHIPLVGGLSIFVAATFGFIFFMQLTGQLSLFIFSSLLIVTVGALDDRFDLSVRVRIFAQLVAAGIIVFQSEVYISGLGNILGFGDITLGNWGMPFTVLAILAAINAYNMIDGIDGLLGSMAMVAFTGAMIYAGLNNQYVTLLFSIIMAAALLPFWFRNTGILLPKIRKVFMGDAGSMFIGMSVVWLLTLMINVGLAGDNGTNVRPISVLWLVAIPLMDMCAIMVRRVIRGQSPFLPDRDHLHHIFIRAGFSQREALAVITLLAVTLVIIGIVLEIFKVPELMIFILFVSIFCIYCVGLRYSWRLVSWVRNFREIEK
ncbi:UDP-N-acetylglucosamine--undecaprenyl-phosphate N-acetylglucosaminephosphotransferase [Idiomarina sp.]|uniref:UDP-N-acetylglucosamine--undecaprenyl-phosphate N-acetylglucosaminephosphotransferase n=1 Tax=Idiomarina sp. TaxID=1874361 RepID=UPI00258CE788|nr:UDP-N-acetylglucosamine--undecaprenyl-phosphate N-acetylglucosaminephosphotransferase [Idiomarina sp.]